MQTYILHDRPCGTRLITAIAVIILSRAYAATASSRAYPQWGHQRAIYLNTTPSGANIEETVVDFPVLVRLTDLNFEFSQARSDGADIRFSKADGTPLAYEIERWNDGVAAEVWVLVDTIWGRGVTEIAVHWGNGSAQDSSRPASVFSTANGFVGVWHLGESASGKGTQGLYKDATANGYDGDDSVSATGTGGLIANGNEIDTAGRDAITVPGLPSADWSNVTVSAWVRLDNQDGWKAFVDFGYDATDGFTIGRTTGGGSVFKAKLSVIGRQEVFGEPLTTDGATWHYVAGTYGNDTMLMYDNGDTTGARWGEGSVIEGATGPLYIGGRDDSWASIRGLIDEVRVSDVARSPAWIKLCFENQRPQAQQSLVEFGIDYQPEDYATWSHHADIILNTSASGANVPGTVYDFPVLVRLTSANADVFAGARENGEDIRFTKDDGDTPLFYQIERWDDAGEEAEIWVLADTVLGGESDQRIMMHWGKSGVASRSDGAGVFSASNGFAGVWHLAESGTGTRYDASSSGNDGTPAGYSGDEAVSGIIGGADNPGASGYIDIGNASSLRITGPIMLSMWGKGYTDGGVLVSKYLARYDKSYRLAHTSSQGTVRLTLYPDGSGGFNRDNATGFSTSEWYHLGYAWDGDSMYSYVNGALDVSGAYTDGIYDSDARVLIGAEDSGSTAASFLNHAIDEVRIETVARSADWVRLCHENQKAHQTLVRLVEDYSTWRHQQRITLNTTSSGARIDDDVLGFPVLVRLDSTNFIFSEAGAGGGDVRFAKIEGTALPYEIERWDASAEAAEIWVRIDTVYAGNASQAFVMYWGKDNVGSRSDGAAVFNASNGYTGVYHMNTGTLSGSDATGTNDFSIIASSSTASAVGLGREYDGTQTDKIGNTGYSLWNADSFTIALWVHMDGYDSDGMGFLSCQEYQTSGFRLGKIWNKHTPEFWSTESGGGLQAIAETVMDSLTWYHVAVTARGTSDNPWVKLYLDADSVGGDTESSAANGIIPSAKDMQLGYIDGLDQLRGMIDEVRFSNVIRSESWIRLCRENQKPNQALVIMEEFGTWPYTKDIALNTTSSGADVNETVTGFPVVVRLHGGNFTFSQAHRTGRDLRFSKPDGTPLAHEIERWDSAAGLAEIWVKVDTIQGNGTTTIRMHWGKQGVGDASNSAAVFGSASGFAGVWHMAEDPENGGESILDRTANGIHGTPTGDMTAEDLVTGAVGKGLDFDGIDDEITFQDGGEAGPLNLTKTLTVSAWVRLDSADNQGKTALRGIFKRGSYWVGYEYTNRKILFEFKDDPLTGDIPVWISFSDINELFGRWYHLAGTFDGTTQILYINGAPVDSNAHESGIRSSASSLRIGSAANTAWANVADGIIDELRIAGGARSAPWIKLEYENQRPGGRLVTVSGETCIAAVIDTHPQSRNVVAGEQARFSTAASGTDLEYQWQRKGGGSWSPVSGADSGSYSLTAATDDDGARFRCVVSGACGAPATSNEAVLSVSPAPDSLNPVAVAGKYVDSTHVNLTLSGFDRLPPPSQSPLEYVDTIGVWYSSAEYPETPDPLDTRLFRFALEDLLDEGDPYSVKVTVPLLSGLGDSAYYFAAAPFWRLAAGDSIPGFVPGNGARVLMLDTAKTPILLTIDDLSYSLADTTVTVDIANTGAIPASARYLGVWYGFRDSVDFADDVYVRWLDADQARGSDPYTVSLCDPAFAGDLRYVYVAVVLEDAGGALSSHLLDSTQVGAARPQNTAVLEADNVTPYSVVLSWNTADSVRIWYGTQPVPRTYRVSDRDFIAVVPSADTDSVRVRTLNEQTTYFFGLQVFGDGLWSSVTESSSVSITTPKLPASADTLENRLRVDAPVFDTATNTITVPVHVDGSGGFWHDSLQAGIAYAFGAYPAKDTGLQVIELAETDTTVTLRLRESLRFSTRYYIAAFLREPGAHWAPPSDSARDTVTTGPFTWQVVAYYTPDDTMTDAFNNSVRLRWNPEDLPGIDGLTDTLRYEELSGMTPGLVRVGAAFSFSRRLASPPFWIGMGHGKLPWATADAHPCIYRDSAGSQYVVHGCTAEDSVVWVRTNRLGRPFVVAADTVPPEITFVDTDTAAQIPRAGAVINMFVVSDNINNPLWVLKYGLGNGDYASGWTDTLGAGLDTAERTIPAEYASDVYGLRAILIVSDGARTDTVNISRQVTVSNTDDFVTPPLQWMPVRATGDLDDRDMTAALADIAGAGNRWSYDSRYLRVFRWYPHDGNEDDTAKWVEYHDSLDKVFSLSPGRLLWAKTREKKGIRLGPGATTSLKQAVEIELAAEDWTDVAVPFKFGVRLSDVLAATGAYGDTLEVCRWKWEDSVYVADDVYVPGLGGLDLARDTLKYRVYQRYDPQSDAYSVYNPLDTAIVLKIPPVPPAMAPLARARRAGTVKGQWSVAVKTAGRTPANTVYCGYTPGGEGVTYHVVRPGFTGSNVRVLDRHGNAWGHAVARETPEGGAAFELKFINNEAGRDVLGVSLDPVTVIPDGMHVKFFVPESRTYENEDGAHEVKVGGGGAEYRWLVVGTEQFCENFLRKFNMFPFAILGVRPNPFSRRIFLRYSLPYKDLRSVDFAIYDLRGRTIWKHALPGNRIRPGAAELMWDGSSTGGTRIAAGMYVLRMTARVRDSNKKLVSQTKLTRVP
ncbi:MAG: DUF2341 domain-containing protein [Chitinivibrionales bacterium]|nr:DUF2341 domain-containing protein [Chitinivibrionales bacterium]MBD3395098.1 DUF2341 domain-containing protein [Chitinivibrionales bacterium]